MRLSLFLTVLLLIFINGYAQTSSNHDSLDEAKHAERKKVLILFSFRPTLPVAAQWDKGIRSVLDADTEFKIVSNIEYLDRNDIDDKKHIQILLDLYRHRYSNPKPDLIIPILNESLDLILKYEPDLFPDVPVVFGGVERQFITSQSLPSNFTGYLTDIDYTSTLELALQLHPKTRNVVVVAGAGPIVQRWRTNCRKVYRAYEDRYNFTYLFGLPMSDILEKVGALPPQTIIIALPVLVDGNGDDYIGNESNAQICESSIAPVYTFWDVSLGTGIVGGYMSSFEKEAQVVAQLGMRILKGENPADIPVTEAPKYAYMFDWRQLERWGISESDLPEDSLIEYQEYTIWDEYQGRIIVIATLILLQTLVILYLINQRRKRFQLEQKSSDQVAFEKLLLAMSSDFTRLPVDQVEAKILEGLAKTGSFFKADRVYLYRINWDQTHFSISHLWEAEGIKVDQVVHGKIVKDVFPWLYEKLANMEEVIIPNVEDLCVPEKMAEYRYCQQIGIQSFLIIPVQLADTPLCAIGFDAVRLKMEWPPDSRNHLRLIGEIFAIAIERQHSELRLIAAEQKYRTVADYSFDWEYWQNPDGSFHWISPSCERISGYSAEKFIENPSLLTEIIVPEDIKFLEKHCYDSEKKKKSNDIIFRIKKADGEVRWIEHSCQPVIDEQGNNRGIRASNRDITTREFFKAESDQLRTELAHLERVVTISALTSALAHEINQPLAAILSYAQAALRFMDSGQPDYDNVHKALQGIVSDNKRAAAVVNRLRGLVKKGSTGSEQFSIKSSIKDVTSLINSELVMRNAAVKLDLDAGEIEVIGDPIQVQQVMINLLSNALDAVESRALDKRIITISTKCKDSSDVIISVFDTGAGIPADILKTIFTPFHTTKSKGIGLGLAICKSIIEAQGGTIWAENNPDGGARFSFTLPVVKN